MILNIEEVLAKLSKTSDNTKLKKKLEDLNQDLDKLISQKHANKFGKGNVSSKYFEILIFL